jgi:hypothetical protein
MKNLIIITVLLISFSVSSKAQDVKIDSLEMEMITEQSTLHLYLLQLEKEVKAFKILSKEKLTEVRLDFYHELKLSKKRRKNHFEKKSLASFNPIPKRIVKDYEEYINTSINSITHLLDSLEN